MQTIIYTLKKSNKPILALVLLMIVTVVTTTYHNHKKKVNETNLKNLLNNIYLKKTLSNIFNQLDPKYEKIEWGIVSDLPNSNRGKSGFGSTGKN